MHRNETEWHTLVGLFRFKNTLKALAHNMLGLCKPDLGIVSFGLLIIMHCREVATCPGRDAYEYYFISLHCLQALNFYN